MANISITIPQKAEGSRELVAIPRKEYEGLLKFYNIQKVKNKKGKKKKEGKLTKGLGEALVDVKAGRISKAYDDVDEMMRDMLS